METKKMIQDFKDLSEKMIALLDRETTYLQEKRISDFSSVQPEKLALVTIYEKQSTHVLKLLKSSEEIKTEDMESLQDTVLSLRKSMANNSTALKAMNESNNRFIKTLIDSIQKENKQPTRYGRGGTPLSKQNSKEIVGIMVPRHSQSG